MLNFRFYLESRNVDLYYDFIGKVKSKNVINL